ncbi:MAG: type II toxin-antitoxin system VapC family toxin [Deltaproteobacteria bacterium]|nr:MAG: type II toxin-antitoxin system VapC family toxin [Deltaproteobacteria bacterium]
MSYLLDTCLVSELIKKTPNEGVVGWVRRQEEARFFLSVLTVGEIAKGIARLDDSRRKQRLLEWLERDLLDRFEGRILPVDEKVSLVWGRVTGEAERQGLKIPVVDGLIAATALANELVVVTRDTRPMERFGARTLSPWS